MTQLNKTVGPSHGEWATSLLLAALLVPIAVLSHEGGHLLGYWVFDFPAPVLHYASSGFEGERAFWTALRAGDLEGARGVVDIKAAGLSAAFGLTITYGTIGAAVLTVSRYSSASGACLGIAAAMRFPPVLLLTVLGRSEHTDEAHVSQVFGVPPTMMFLLAVAALVVAFAWPARVLRRSKRGNLVFAMAAGAVAGTTAWMTVIGPILLP